MDYVERLREISAAGEQIDPSAYVDIVRRAFRESPADARELLQSAYQKGLQEAYRSRKSGALAKVALMGATLLNLVGEHAGAVARLEQALQMSDYDPGSRVEILAEKAFYQALSAIPESAVETRDEALAAMPSGADDAETSLSVGTTAAIVSLLLVTPGAVDEAVTAISLARSHDFDWMASALMVYLISALAAAGEVDQATAWADGLHGYAASQSHRARELDAMVGQHALRARRRPVDFSDDLIEIGGRTLNVIAVWRLHIVRLHVQLMHGDSVGAMETVDALPAAQSDLNDGFTIGSDGFARFAEVHLGATSVPETAPPRVRAALFMVGGVLATAEAVAIGGSQSLAADWLRWFETHLPAQVATSLEWPACRKRIEALLLLRLGREREAITRFQSAIRCCEERQDNVEAAIGRLQLSEALLRGTTGSMLPSTHARTLAENGAAELRALGVDPIPFAYAASRTFLREEQMPERGGLTPREAQVLGRLAKGLTYREIGAELEINSRTVGVHASHCYEKLGVRNRVEAVRLAQELGIV